MEQLNEKLKLYKLPILLSLLGVVLILGGIFSSGLINFKKTTIQAQNFPKESLVNSANFNGIKVDISGAVIKPAVYSITADSRVEDAIKAAGGFSPEANA
ncbi:MAG: SLBB domain-containing protein, partial [Candidatus Paceibacterales bacterium]